MVNISNLDDFRKWLVHRIERENALGLEAEEFAYLDGGLSKTAHYQMSAAHQRTLTNFDLALNGEFSFDEPSISDE